MDKKNSNRIKMEYSNVSEGWVQGLDSESKSFKFALISTYLIIDITETEYNVR